MVEAVDLNGALAGGAAQLGGQVDLDGVGNVTPAVALYVVAFEVLKQAAAHGHVDDLLPATEAEDRDLSLARLAEQVQLRVVELPIDWADLRTRLLPVQGRIHVPTAGQEQTVQRWERVAPGHEVNRLATGGLDSPAVGLVIV